MIVAIGTVVVLLTGPLMQSLRSGIEQARTATANPNGERNRLGKLGRQLQEMVPRHRRIYVLDGHAGVYVQTDRLPASIITQTVSAADVEAVLKDLDALYARALVVPEAAVSLGPVCDDSCTRRLQRLLSDYEAVHHASGYRVLVQRQHEDLPKDQS